MEAKNYEAVVDFLADESFCRWVENEAEKDALFWVAWIRRNPDKKVLVEEATLVLKGTAFKFQNTPESPQMLQEEWKKLHKKTLLHKPDMVVTPPQKTIKRFFQIEAWKLNTAASIALLVVAGILYYQFIFNGQVTHQTAYGEQLKIVLPDSTILDLNANSKLTYRRQFPRKVWLDGEAYFEVKKKPQSGANFSVITNDLTIEVLGTSFNVSEKEDKTEVILEEGSIKLNLKRAFEPELFMKPGDLVAFSTKEQQKIEKRIVKPQPLTSWKDGMLQFEDVPLNIVMEKIKEIYGWQAIYENEELLSRKISTPLPSNDLKNTLTILQKAIGIEIEQVESKKILILKKRSTVN